MDNPETLKLCKFILRVKKCSSYFSARYELGRFPIDNFIKTQSLLYEDRLLAVDTPETLKECFSLSKSLHEKGFFSWYSYFNQIYSTYYVSCRKELFL
jgi:hypothetical protein